MSVVLGTQQDDACLAIYCYDCGGGPVLLLPGIVCLVRGINNTLDGCFSPCTMDEDCVDQTGTHLLWSDVDFDNGLIRVRQPKSGEDYYIPMNDELREILRGLPSRLRSQWVFPSSTGKTPLNPKNFLHRVFTPALRRAKISSFRWHDLRLTLRHTFASRLVMAGADLRTVQELMGHKTTTMTIRYAHLSPAHKLAAVQRLVHDPTATTIC